MNRAQEQLNESATQDTRAEAGAEYGVEFDAANLQFFPFRPTKIHAPAKAYSMPLVVYLDDGARSVRPMRWGLLPAWAKSEFDMPQPFNAQAEGIEKKPFFRDTFKKRRCLVPASAFFDFNKAKTRFRFKLPNLPHFAFSGLFNVWGWTPQMDARLGTEPDEVLAREWGKSATAVRVRRARLGIAKVDDHRKRPKRRRGDQAECGEMANS